MGFVATWIAKVHFSVLNDWIEPVCDVERTVWPHAHINGAKCGVITLDNFSLFPTDKARSIGCQFETADTVPAEIAGNGIALPVVWKGATGNEFQATVLGGPRIQPGKNTLGTYGCSIIGAWHDEINPLAASSICGEALAEAIVMVTPRIHQSALDNFQTLSGWVKAPDSATAQTARSVRSFDMRVNVNGLVEVQSAIEVPTNGVNHVVCVFGAKTRKYHGAPVGLQIAIGVFQKHKVCRVDNVGAIPCWFHTSWN